MRKTIIGDPVAPTSEPAADGWLDLEAIAQVEMTSEDQHHPIEDALTPGSFRPGWRAASPGVQQILFRFDRPLKLHRIRLRFAETERERTQEFSLRWTGDGDPAEKEIVRQQWNFSPSGSTSQIEEIHVDLTAVTSLRLIIDPDQGRAAALASLAEFRVA
ncbi:MAG: hypothetical protein NVS9B15_03330 [Acidobacteriaceae bacterium]